MAHEQIETKERFPNEEEAWDTLARRELELGGASKEIIEKCIQTYQTGLEKNPTQKMWSLYLDFLLKFNEDPETLRNFKKNCLKSAFETGHNAEMLTEKHYVQWVEKVEDVDTGKVLQWGTEKYKDSPELWSQRLRYYLRISDSVGGLAVFREAISNPRLPDQISLWNLMLRYYNLMNPPKGTSLMKEGVNNMVVGADLKGRYVECLAISKGISAARRAYNTLAAKPPLSLALHASMAKIEDAQPTLSIHHSRNVYENAIKQFGESNTDVWAWFIQFEQKFGDPKNALTLFSRAQSTLMPNLVDVFTSRYKLSGGSEIREICLNEEAWDTLARRELELGGESEESSVKKCIETYETGLEKKPTQKMWSLYLECLLEFTEDTGILAYFKKNCLKNAFETAHYLEKLTEKHYLQWIEKVEDVDTEEVLQWATEKHKDSLELWSRRLRYYLNRADSVRGFLVFREAISNPRLPDQLSLWIIMLKYYKTTDPPKSISLLKKGLNNMVVGAALKGSYVEWLAESQGILAAREAYNTLAAKPPLSLSLHATMAALEDAQPTLSIPHARNVYKNAVKQFGESNTDVWMWFVQFEQKFGDAKNAPILFSLAQHTLMPNLVDDFISKYNTAFSGLRHMPEPATPLTKPMEDEALEQPSSSPS